MNDKIVAQMKPSGICRKASIVQRLRVLSEIAQNSFVQIDWRNLCRTGETIEKCCDENTRAGSGTDDKE